MSRKDYVRTASILKNVVDNYDERRRLAREFAACGVEVW